MSCKIFDSVVCRFCGVEISLIYSMCHINLDHSRVCHLPPNKYSGWSPTQVRDPNLPHMHALAIVDIWISTIFNSNWYPPIIFFFCIIRDFVLKMLHESHFHLSSCPKIKSSWGHAPSYASFCRKNFSWCHSNMSNEIQGIVNNPRQHSHW